MTFNFNRIIISFGNSRNSRLPWILINLIELIKKFIGLDITRISKSITLNIIYILINLDITLAILFNCMIIKINSIMIIHLIIAEMILSFWNIKLRIIEESWLKDLVRFQGDFTYVIHAWRFPAV